MTTTAPPRSRTSHEPSPGADLWYWWRRAIVASIAGTGAGLLLPLVLRAALGFEPLWNREVYVTSVGFIAPLFFLAGIGCFDHWARWARGHDIDPDDHSMHGGRSWRDYLVVNTDHKVIGIQYLAAVSVFFLAGGVAAMLVRAELFGASAEVGDAQTYNGLFSGHATLMIFAFIIPGWTGLANYVLPLMIGARDMAFPRLNALSFWVFALGGLMLTLGMALPSPYDTGWTAYTPLATQSGTGQTLFELGIQFTGASSIMAGINILVTIIGMRAPGMTVWRMPLFIWTMAVQSILIVFATPFLAGSQFMTMFDRVMGTNFFVPLGGGDVIMYQHVFWFYSHPTVYIWVLPGFGVVTEIIAAFARKPVFGYRAMAFAAAAIAVLGFGVWAHHMFVSGMAAWLRVPMMITTIIIAVPTGIKIFTWLATLWEGRIRWATPMLFAVGFIVTFVVGGLSGVMLGTIPVDINVSDTYFIVAHIHYVVIPGALMTMIAAVYYWFPKITGRMYDERLGKWHFWSFFVAMNATFFPMHWLGLQGMPRRVAAYDERFETLNQVVSVASFVLGLSMVIFVYNIVWSWRRGTPAPWNPHRAKTLEWQTPSPPPLFNFEAVPQVVGGPYQYGIEGARHAVVFASPEAGGGELTEERREPVVVVANRSLGSGRLLDALVRRSLRERWSVTLIAPVEGGRRAPARRRLDRAIAVLRERGLEVDGTVVDDGVIDAAVRAAEERDARLVVVGILADETRGWRAQDVPDRIRKRTRRGVEVLSVTSDDLNGERIQPGEHGRPVLLGPSALEDPGRCATMLQDVLGASGDPVVLLVALENPLPWWGDEARERRDRASRSLGVILGRLVREGFAVSGEVVDGSAKDALEPYPAGDVSDVVVISSLEEGPRILSAPLADRE